MNFAQQKAAYEALKGAEHLDADRALLAKKLPESPFLKKKMINSERLQQDILWALLKGGCSEKDIRANRVPSIDTEKIIGNCSPFIAQIKEAKTLIEANALLAKVENEVKPLTEEQQAKTLEEAKAAIPDFEGIHRKKVAEKAGVLSAKIEKAETKEAAEKLLDEIKEITSSLPDEVSKKMIEFAQSRVLDFDNKKPEHLLIEAQQRLLNLDLNTVRYNEKRSVFLALQLDEGVENMKSDTITPILETYKANLLKEDNGNGEENTPIPADPEKVNELTEENEELKEVNEELESENEDLKTNLEDKEAENEELQEKLEEVETEKKN